MFSRGGYYSMRSRAPVALLACLAGLCATPAAASAAAPETLAPYTVDATPSQLMELHERGFDVSEGGADGSNGTQPIDIVATPKQVAALEQAGIEAEALPIDAPKTKSAALGDSPNPYFNVYRSYMEPGGIADEMKADRGREPRRDEARADRHVDARQADLRHQDDRRTRARCRTARATRSCSRGQPRARVDRRRDGPPSAGLVRRAQERPEDPRADPDARAVVPADPEPGRLRLHVHLRPRRHCRCRATTASAPPTTTASGARRCATTTTTASTATAGDGVDPNRNYPAKRGIDEEGASQQHSAARPTAARTRCPSPRTWPSTASSVASSSRPTSTTTPRASCC